MYSTFHMQIFQCICRCPFRRAKHFCAGLTHSRFHALSRTHTQKAHTHTDRDTQKNQNSECSHLRLFTRPLVYGHIRSLRPRSHALTRTHTQTSHIDTHSETPRRIKTLTNGSSNTQNNQNSIQFVEHICGLPRTMMGDADDDGNGRRRTRATDTIYSHTRLYIYSAQNL